MYAEVLIEYNAKVLDKTFTYKIPTNMNVHIGNKVKVLFSNKEIYGIVVDIKNNIALDNVNEIICVVNPQIRLNNELIELGKYLKEITFTTLIKAYQTMLPTSLKINKNKSLEKYDEYLKLNKDKSFIYKYIENNKRSKTKIDILNRLLKGEVINKKNVSNVYKDLIKEDIIKLDSVRNYRLNSFPHERILHR